MKFVVLFICIPIFLILSILFSLVFGSVIRYINEGDKFKSPFDSNKSFEYHFKNKEFWKTFITGLFVYVAILLIISWINQSED